MRRAGDIAIRLTRSGLRQKCLVVQQVSMSSSKSLFLFVQVCQRCWVDRRSIDAGVYGCRAVTTTGCREVETGSVVKFVL